MPLMRGSDPCLPGSGRLLAVLADLPAILSAPFIHGANLHRVIAGPAAKKAEDLAALAELAEKAAFKPVIDLRFAFARIADAYRVADSGRKKGSVVVTLEPRAWTR